MHTYRLYKLVILYNSYSKQAFICINIYYSELWSVLSLFENNCWICSSVSLRHSQQTSWSSRQCWWRLVGVPVWLIWHTTPPKQCCLSATNPSCGTRWTCWRGWALKVWAQFFIKVLLLLQQLLLILLQIASLTATANTGYYEKYYSCF